MRLLKWTSDGQIRLTEDLHDDERPPYAILSHTWALDNNQEVTFADIGMQEGLEKDGYRKIQFCRDQARIDGITHFWVDTCCIDKFNHVELSEAITSMFRWYQNAVKCYVYLADVPARKRNHDGEVKPAWESHFANSRWFTRGWTLQELLAPKVVEFFSQDTVFLGDRKTLASQIHVITGIPIDALCDTPLSEFSIAARMRWAKARQTKKPEDKAYSLLGLFDVSISVIYGEGEEKAFRRLQREIQEQAGKEVYGAPDPRTPTSKIKHQALPRRYRQFFGRKDILAALSNTFSVGRDAGDLTVVTIDGLGGVGKTQIALQYAYSQRHDCPVIVWVHSEQKVTIEQDISRAAVAMGLLGADLQNPEKTCLLFRDWLQETSELGSTASRHVIDRLTDCLWLVIFDNVEDPALLDDVWPSYGNGSILLTARAESISFDLGTERFEVPKFDENDGAELLLNLVGMSRNANIKAAKQLVQRLDGHALAISQMAAVIRLRGFDLVTFNDTYDKNKKDLHCVHRPTQATGYKYYLDTVWELSFKFLDVAARTLLAIISCLSPDSIPARIFLPRDSESRVLDLEFCNDELKLSEVEEQLLALALINKDPHEGSISIHRLVQTQFLYHMSAGERQKAFDNASKLLYEHFPKQVSGRLMLASWSVCDRYIEHVTCLVTMYRTETKWNASLSPPLDFHKLLCNAAWYLSERGLSSDLDVTLRVAVDAYNACTNSAKDPVDYAHLCNTIGINAHNKGDFSTSEHFLMICYTTRESSKDPDEEEFANIYNNIGNVHFSKQDYATALTWHRKAEKIRMSRGDDWANNKGMTHLNIGRSMWKLGDKDGAWQQLQSAEKQFLLGGNWYLLAHSYLLMGTFHRENQDYVQAEEHYRKSMAIMVADGHAPQHFTVCTLWYKLGCIALDVGKVEQAIISLRKALAMADSRAVAKPDEARIKHKLSEALLLTELASTTKEAISLDKEARKIRKSIEGDSYNDLLQTEEAYDKIVCGNSR